MQTKLDKHQTAAEELCQQIPPNNKLLLNLHARPFTVCVNLDGECVCGEGLLVDRFILKVLLLRGGVVLCCGKLKEMGGGLVHSKKPPDDQQVLHARDVWMCQNEDCAILDCEGELRKLLTNTQHRQLDKSEISGIKSFIGIKHHRLLNHM